ncbi:hypothetical protein ACFE04_002121 [Oxalis oulophora]
MSDIKSEDQFLVKDDQQQEVLDLGFPKLTSVINGQDQSRRDVKDDDDDGFKTPTSMDHKIPQVVIQMNNKQYYSPPPAPRKPKALKRKISSSSSSSSHTHRGVHYISKDMQTSIPLSEHFSTNTREESTWVQRH